MVRPPSLEIRRLSASDIPLMRSLVSVFAEAFDEPKTYGEAIPRDHYLERLLAGEHFVALVARLDGVVVAGLAAYVLVKFEQERSEIYIYDLAVSAAHRRKGIATALIEELKRIGNNLGAWVIFVQADRDDSPAIELYKTLGKREAVVHFDIAVADPA